MLCEPKSTLARNFGCGVCRSGIDDAGTPLLSPSSSPLPSYPSPLTPPLLPPSRPSPQSVWLTPSCSPPRQAPHFPPSPLRSSQDNSFLCSSATFGAQVGRRGVVSTGSAERRGRGEPHGNRSACHFGIFLRYCRCFRLEMSSLRQYTSEFPHFAALPEKRILWGIFICRQIDASILVRLKDIVWIFLIATANFVL